MTNYFDFIESGMVEPMKAVTEFLVGYRRFNDILECELETFYDWIAIRHFQLQATIIEIYGIDCVDEQFIDKQLDWLLKWKKQVEGYRM